MIVVVLSVCPPALRGDLTKWLFEVDTNVYVGKLSARVRDDLWDRIVKYCGTGKATMIYSANNEQGMVFRTHNGNRIPVDYEGLTLMMKPAG